MQAQVSVTPSVPRSRGRQTFIFEIHSSRRCVLGLLVVASTAPPQCLGTPGASLLITRSPVEASSGSARSTMLATAMSESESSQVPAGEARSDRIPSAQSSRLLVFIGRNGLSPCGATYYLSYPPRLRWPYLPFPRPRPSLLFPSRLSHSLSSSLSPSSLILCLSFASSSALRSTLTVGLGRFSGHRGCAPSLHCRP